MNRKELAEFLDEIQSAEQHVNTAIDLLRLSNEDDKEDVLNFLNHVDGFLEFIFHKFNPKLDMDIWKKEVDK